MTADLKIFTDEIEEKALEQCNTIAVSPVFEDAKIRIMPDVHAGKGCVIGFTATGMTKLIPNIIGVDISCGMLTAKLADSVDLEQLDKVINERVPSGFNVHAREDDEAQEFLDELTCRDSIRNTSHLLKSLGTLGGGNHFIEVDVDEDGDNYLVIHTGSRNLGLQVANIYQELAVKHCAGRDEATTSALIAELKAAGRQREISSKLAELRSNAVKVDDDLAWCSEADSRDYLHDAWVATRFAHRNREKILDIILDGIGVDIEDMFHTVHNYVDLRAAGNPVIRKGAVSADAGERLLIPMNMRDGCLLCVGRGNEDWNCSAPHGAGRLMSRTQAAKIISLDDFRTSMDGIYSTSVCESTLDESPFAYKSMASILDRIGDTVEVQKILKPVYNYKAH